MSVGIQPSTPPPPGMLSMENHYRATQLVQLMTVERAAVMVGDLITATLVANASRIQLPKAGLDPQYQARIAHDISNPSGDTLQADIDFLKAKNDKMSVMGPESPVVTLPDNTSAIAAQNPPSQYSIPQATPQDGGIPTPVAGPMAATAPAVGQNQSNIYGQGVQPPNSGPPAPVFNPSGSYSIGIPEANAQPPSLNTPHRPF